MDSTLKFTYINKGHAIGLRAPKEHFDVFKTKIASLKKNKSNNLELLSDLNDGLDLGANEREIMKRKKQLSQTKSKSTLDRGR